MKRIELLSPAGSIEKMRYAFHYGADAVYLGVPEYSLRVRINKFSEKDIVKAVEYAHNLKKKIYITLNIYAHNRHLMYIVKHLKFLSRLEIDGVIVSDPGIIVLVKKHLPNVDIHLSTQANATNWQSVKFWKEQGMRRIILAREVTLSEIKEIRKKVPGVELEYFVHGAMCMSYSGRCLLSSWMTGRSANLGDCAQPCRWSHENVSSFQVLEEKFTGLSFPCKRESSQRIKFNSLDSRFRGNDIKNIKLIKRVGPDQVLYMGIREKMKGYEIDLEEDRHGTYFFNSRDLNLIEHVSELIDAGVTSLKIEGRAKSAYYVAVVTRAYRNVVDATVGTGLDLSLRDAIKIQKKELANLTNRGYTTGFLLGGEPGENYSGKIIKSQYEFVGEIIGTEDGLNIVKVHNAIYLKDDIEAVTPEGNIRIKIKRILDADLKEVPEAHGGHEKKYYFELSQMLQSLDLLRRKI